MSNNFIGSITGSTFTGNSANNTSGGYANYGGAVYVNSDFTGSITGSTFTDNNTGNVDSNASCGGAIYMWAAICKA